VSASRSGADVIKQWASMLALPALVAAVLVAAVVF
jgi:hypothetical protein